MEKGEKEEPWDGGGREGGAMRWKRERRKSRSSAGAAAAPFRAGQ